ncbi:MAG: hypothetical protein ACI87E_001020 [Mariniblastus sp.]|jgi:hypothetical protein
MVGSLNQVGTEDLIIAHVPRETPPISISCIPFFDCRRQSLCIQVLRANKLCSCQSSKRFLPKGSVIARVPRETARPIVPNTPPSSASYKPYGLLYGAALWGCFMGLLYGQLFSNEMKFNFAGESRAIAANMYISPAWVSVRSTGRVEGDAVIEDSQNQPGLLQWVDHHPAQ